MARPFLKWAGGKTQLLPQLLAKIPPVFGSYYEPFLGGGALFFALEQAGRFRGELPGRPHAILSDINAELVETYRLVARAPNRISDRLSGLANDPEVFAAVRALRTPMDVDIIGIAARMIYLNKTCYNGLYRVNASGGFNAPFGHYKNPAIVDRDNLVACSNAMQIATIMHGGFEEILLQLRPPEAGDLVYLDPPYVPASSSSNFTAYTPGGFGIAFQYLLAGVVRTLAARGVHVIVSQSDTPLVRTLYDGFEILPVKARRSINSNGERRGPVGEVIITAPIPRRRRRGGR